MEPTLLENILETVQTVIKIMYLYVEYFVLLILPKHPKSLAGEIILITGSANGIGKEICKKLASSGAILVLWDISQKQNEETALEVKAMGTKQVHTDTVDMSSRPDICQAATRLRQKVGPVTVFVNNAGIAPISPFIGMSATAIQKTFDINILAHFWTLQEFLPEMIAANKGHIVTMASVLSLHAHRGTSCYMSAKHAVHGFIESLRDEVSHLPGQCDNVKFTTVYPFFTKTRFSEESRSGIRIKFRFPWLTPFLEADWVAEKIVEGICYEKEYVYLPGFHWIWHAFAFFEPIKVQKAFQDFFILEMDFDTTPKSKRFGANWMPVWMLNQNCDKIDN